MKLIEILDNASKTEEAVAGIDFGTTNSVIAVAYKTKICIVPIDVDNITSHCLPTNWCGIQSLKRFMGKTNDEMIQHALHHNTPILIDDKSKDLFFYIQNRRYSLIELISKVLSCLIQTAEKFICAKITRAVLTTPAHFNNYAKSQLIKAAQMSRIEVLRLIAEPTAAAYALCDLKEDKNYLIYDLGGGTFDISIVETGNAICRVLATGGHNMLGGDDIDRILLNHLLNKYPNLLTLSNISDLKYKREIQKLVEYIKTSLSSLKATKIKYKSFVAEITRAEFEKVIESLLESTFSITYKTYLESAIDKIHGIILVGGSSIIPCIRNKLVKMFDAPIVEHVFSSEHSTVYGDVIASNAIDKRTKQNHSLSETLVALGAAKQAENLVLRKDSVVIDVTPLSLGLETYGDVVEVLIPKNTPIPCAVTQIFTNHSAGQTGIVFHILQGERLRASECLSITKFELRHALVKHPGVLKVSVTFALDNNGVLSITTFDEDNNQFYQTEVTPFTTVTEQVVKNIIADTRKNLSADFEWIKIRSLAIKSERLINNVNFIYSRCDDLEQDILNSIETAIAIRNSLMNAVELCNYQLMREHYDSLLHIVNKLLERISARKPCMLYTK